MNSRQFAVVVVITFIVGMVWLVSDIIFNTKPSVPISDKLQTLLEPVNPTFNARVLELIQNETLDKKSVLVENPTLPETQSSPSPSPSSSPAVGANPSPSPSASPLSSVVPSSSPTPQPSSIDATVIEGTTQ